MTTLIDREEVLSAISPYSINYQEIIIPISKEIMRMECFYIEQEREIISNTPNTITIGVDWSNNQRVGKKVSIPIEQGWINMKERKPCDDEEYIICTSDGLVTSVAWSTDENNWIVGITNWRTDIFGKITHWQPLPLPPTL